MKITRQKSCEGKTVYRSAWPAFMESQKASIKTGERIDYYRCLFCGKYHIGHVKRK
jgi:hypothetical protein